MLNENELSELIKGSRENEYCEFKEAYCNFNNEKLFESCVAISNVKGGFLIFGVTDKKPRRIIGTNAYQNINKIKK
nr:ATP-binding protein [Caldisericia bacterium]